MTKAQKRLIKAQKKAQKKELKKNKGRKMFNKFTHAAGNLFNGGAAALTKPVDGTDQKTLNIVLFKQSFLNGLANQCVPVAGGSEFQVHYRALQIIVSKENVGRIVYTIPTMFFNFNQTVTSASVDYDLVEVDKLSKEYQPLSMDVANTVAKLFPKAFFESKGFNVEFREDEIGSIHRHPGDFSFSSIDLDNNPRHPGVIYRRGNAEDLIQTDSVMYITGVAGAQHVKLVTTQTRVVNVNLLDNGGIEGSYNRAKTVALILKDTDTEETIQNAISVDFNAFFNDDISDETINVMADVKKNFLPRYDEVKESQLTDVLSNSAKILNVIAKNTSIVNKVNENLIKSHVVSYRYSGYNYSGYQARTYDHVTGTWVNEEENTPKKFSVLDFLKYKKLDTADTKLSEILDDIVIRELYWMCAGKDEKVVFNLNQSPIEISPVSKTSQLLKVIYKGTTTYKSKSILDNNDLSEELEAAGFEDEEDTSILKLDPTEEFPLLQEATKSNKSNNLEDAQIQMGVEKILESRNLIIPEKLLKDSETEKQCEGIFKKEYPDINYDNNGLLKVYNEDGFKKIAEMAPSDTGLIFNPKTETESMVFVEPIDEGDINATVHFINNAVHFNKMVPLYE